MEDKKYFPIFDYYNYRIVYFSTKKGELYYSFSLSLLNLENFIKMLGTKKGNDQLTALIISLFIIFSFINMRSMIGYAFAGLIFYIIIHFILHDIKNVRYISNTNEIFEFKELDKDRMNVFKSQYKNQIEKVREKYKDHYEIHKTKGITMESFLNDIKKEPEEEKYSKSKIVQSTLSENDFKEPKSIFDNYESVMDKFNKK